MNTVKLSQAKYDKIFAHTHEGKGLLVFISYSSDDKVYAGELKNFLESYGLSAFLAHEDIQPTLDWQEEILRNLRSCDIFIPIFSPAFKDSKWTDQETGIAFGLQKLIIPIRKGVDPYGFIGKLQGCNSESYINVLDVLSNYSSLKDSLISCLLRSLEKVTNFDKASIFVKHLEKCNDLTKLQANEVVRIAIKNDQFGLCWDGRKFLKRFIDNYPDEIDPLFLKVFEKVNNNFTVIYPSSK